MSEQNTMTEENKKTIIAFIAGLLVGGLLVFIFSEPATSEVEVENNEPTETEVSTEENMDEDEDDETIENTSTTSTSGTPSEVTGDGSIDVDNQPAGDVVTLTDVEFPANNGWVGVRDYVDGQMTGVLGVARFSVAEGLTPSSVKLLRSTEAGKTYAVVFYSDNGDKMFSLATDVQLGGAMETFMAR